MLSQSGTGNFACGYFGGLMDAATGLLYAGGGQYYGNSPNKYLQGTTEPAANYDSKTHSAFCIRPSYRALLAPVAAP